MTTSLPSSPNFAPRDVGQMAAGPARTPCVRSCRIETTKPSFVGYFCIGVDAGASQTSAVLTNMRGTLLGPVRFGPGANPNTVELSSSVAGVASLVEGLWSEYAMREGHGNHAGIMELPRQTKICMLAVTVALSGGDSPASCAAYRDALRERLDTINGDATARCEESAEQFLYQLPPHYTIAVVHDSLAPLALILPASTHEVMVSGSGESACRAQNSSTCRGTTTYACVIAGTGSVAVSASLGEGGEFKIVGRRGGWGELVSDEGSAFHATTSLLRSCLRLHDIVHAGRATAIHDAGEEYNEARVVLHAFCVYFDVKVGSISQLAAKMSMKSISKAAVAGFAKRIAVLAEGGNQLCYKTLHDAGQQLGLLLVDLIENQSKPVSDEIGHLRECHPVRVSLVGGMFASWNTGVGSGFMSAMDRIAPQVSLFVMPAESGAALGCARLCALDHFRSWIRDNNLHECANSLRPYDTISSASWSTEPDDLASFVLHIC
jgi:N-acetylglucosamine kinase-like BadF-type ATPase